MKVLFFMRSTVYVRNFESTLRLLADRGHHVHVVADVHRQLDSTDLIGRLCREYPGISHGAPPTPQSTRWPQLGILLRGALDYLRYLRPEYRDAPKLRRRAELKAPAFVTAALRRPLMDTRVGRAVLGRVIHWCDRAVPRDAAIDAFVREHRPDLVLVTPLVEPGSPQSEYLRSARAVGSATGLCVYSWDNLTNKGLIHEPLDVVTVWNEPMKREAVTLHHVPADRVVVTGAAPYDHWFTWQPRSTREAFCTRVGLAASHPYLLYLCSSKFIAPNELPFVRRWIQDVRAASTRLRDIGVLVRPHPQNTEVWRDADLADLENVVIWPRSAGNPVDIDSRADYYDTIFHSAAVVGVNTSAQIESAIVGRGVYSLLAPEFTETQEGTLHFRHLREVNGGLLHVAADMATHARQLEAALCNPQGAGDRCVRFVEAFVRPVGIDQPATPRLVAAIEATAARGAKPDRGPWWASLLRPALGRVAVAIEASERERQLAAARPPRAKRPPKPPKEQKATAKARDAFPLYLQIRDRMRDWRAREPASGPADTPSERRMMAELETFWDASPDIVNVLRQHGRAVTGVAASDYHNPEPSARARLEQELTRLIECGDRTLWIEEPAALGGFGFNGLGKLYNEDTLRFFRVVSLLDEAAVLKEFRDRGSRRTVWEIGGGWGGFAYQFKTLCPNVTYVITGMPELLLLSAVYLMTLFPAARFRCYERACPEAFWKDWDRVDFAFAPEAAVTGMRPPALDLTIDLMALERMSLDRIGRHVQRAYDLGSRYFLSMCPSGETDPDVVSAVQPSVERLYWRHPVSAPGYLARRFAVRAGKRIPIKRTYFLGWRRLHL